MRSCEKGEKKVVPMGMLWMSLFIAILLDQILMLLLATISTLENLDFSKLFTQSSMVLILLCFLLQALSDQQDSYLIKTSTIFYCASSVLAATFASMKASIDPYIYYTVQLAFTTVAHIFYLFLLAGILSFAFQLQSNKGMALFSFVPVYLVMYSAIKLLAIVILNLVILDYSNTAYYLAAVTFLLSVALFVVNQAYSLQAEEQYIFGKPVASTKQIRTAEQFFKLLNQPNNVQMFYSHEDDADVMHRLRVQRFQTFMQSMTYQFVSSAVLSAETTLFVDFYWYIYLYDLIVLACLIKCVTSLVKRFSNACFGVSMCCALSLCSLIVVQVLAVETSTDCQIALIVIVSIVQLSISFLSIFSFGNCDLYEKTTYKYMICAYFLGSQIAILLLNIVEVFQGSKVYISSILGMVLCIGCCATIHIHKEHDNHIQSE